MSMCKYVKFLAVVGMVFCGLATVAQADSTAQQILDLSGTWSFQLDEQKVGLQDRWFEKKLKDKIRLPGSTDEAGFGAKSEPEPTRLTREYRYVGPAWYQKTIKIPKSSSWPKLTRWRLKRPPPRSNFDCSCNRR